MRFYCAGPGGKSLIEIQHLSGANIQISKKGIFAPGTRNRIVTITGTPNAIGAAQYLIEQRINEEEVKRARNNALGVLMQWYHYSDTKKSLKWKGALVRLVKSIGWFVRHTRRVRIIVCLLTSSSPSPLG